MAAYTDCKQMIKFRPDTRDPALIQTRTAPPKISGLYLGPAPEKLLDAEQTQEIEQHGEAGLVEGADDDGHDQIADYGAGPWDRNGIARPKRAAQR